MRGGRSLGCPFLAKSTSAAAPKAPPFQRERWVPGTSLQPPASQVAWGTSEGPCPLWGVFFRSTSLAFGSLTSAFGKSRLF